MCAAKASRWRRCAIGLDRRHEFLQGGPVGRVGGDELAVDAAHGGGKVGLRLAAGGDGGLAAVAADRHVAQRLQFACDVHQLRDLPRPASSACVAVISARDSLSTVATSSASGTSSTTLINAAFDGHAQVAHESHAGCEGAEGEAGHRDVFSWVMSAAWNGVASVRHPRVCLIDIGEIE